MCRHSGRPCDEGQNGQDPRWCRQCWGHLEKGRGEKMLFPTLPRPGAAPPGSGDTHQLQHPPAGTACTDQPLGTSGSFLTRKWFPTETELGARAPKKTPESLGLAAEYLVSSGLKGQIGGENVALQPPADPQETLSCAHASGWARGCPVCR